MDEMKRLFVSESFDCGKTKTTAHDAAKHSFDQLRAGFGGLGENQSLQIKEIPDEIPKNLKPIYLYLISKKPAFGS